MSSALPYPRNSVPNWMDWQLPAVLLSREKQYLQILPLIWLPNWKDIFLKIGDQASSGTAASVISGSRSGEGAVYQSVFYPEYTDKSAAKNKITWAGAVHASFVDALGRMREDTNGNRILDINDKIVVFRKDGRQNSRY